MAGEIQNLNVQSDVLAGEAIEALDDEKASLTGQGGPTKTRDLRYEADELKQCFTRYAFQSIGLCSVAFAGIIQVMVYHPVVALSALGVLPIIVAVCRLGVYKYTGSNRAYGYELYLERTRDVPSEFWGRWKPEYRCLSWEEAMHAWRAIQPSLYEAIYFKPWLLPDRFRFWLKLNRRRPPWFLVAAEIGSGARAKWFPGAYLTNLLVFLYVIAFAAVGLIFIGAIEFFKLTANGRTVDGLNFNGFWVCIVVGIAALVFAIIRASNDFARCRNVRMELLSIPACAIVWQAVVIAHYTAIENSRRYRLSSTQLSDVVRSLRGKEKKDALDGNAGKYVQRMQAQKVFEFQPDGLGMTGYSFWLGQEAASLAAHPLDIQGWIFNRCAHQ